jgi:hypothetical protein
MSDKKKPADPSHTLLPEQPSEVRLPDYPEDPLIPEEDPDIIMDEKLIEPPPYEMPPPGEGP